MTTKEQATQRDSVPYLLRSLANVWDNWCGLPKPIAMDAAEVNGIATVRVTDVAAVCAWNSALKGTSEPTTSLYVDRGPIHSAWVRDWHGWDVYVTADDHDGPRLPENVAAITAECGCPVRYAPEIRGDDVDTLVEHTPGCIALDEDMAAIAAEVPDELAPVVA